MREILFKAKRIDTGEWVEGNLVRSEDADEEFEVLIIPIVNSCMFTGGLCEEDLGFENWHSVDPSTLCQYTGLTDKNWQKIWENDIVEIPTENGYSTIVWNNTEARWEMENTLEEITTDFENYWSYQVEVIGNIFDHPELLEGGTE